MIALSAGHNPTARGACYNGVCEHEEAERWAQLIHTAVSAEVTSVIVPTGSLQSKVAFINGQKACRLAIEVHFNSAGGVGKGCETLYYPSSEKGRRVANVVQAAMVSFLPPNRGVKEGWYKMDRPGVKDYEGDVDGDENPDYFLAKTKCPAIIIEPEFIHRYGVITAIRDIACESIAKALISIYKDAQLAGTGIACGERNRM